MSILTQLKTSTDDLHKAVENTPINRIILSKDFSLPDYKALIENNFYIHHSLEAELLRAFQSLDAPQLHDFFTLKSGWLRKDAKALGITLEDSIAINAPSFATTSQIIGGLYVIEGSMLGGKFIHKALKSNPNLQSVSTFHFFEGYGNSLGEKWQGFRSLAEAQITNIDEAVQAAKDTFLFYKAVFEA